jgi:hypothetical protein
MTDDWTPPAKARKGAPRAVAAVRAKVAHKQAPGSRCLIVYVTEPVAKELGWANGGTVAPAFRSARLRLVPSHSGLRAKSDSPTSKTLRITISGAPLVRAMCAKVRALPYVVEGSTLYVDLPQEWIAAMKLEAWA